MMSTKNILSSAGIFKQSTEEMHTNSNDDLNLNNFHQAELMEDDFVRQTVFNNNLINQTKLSS